jgi:hypothetical protein
MRAFIGCAVLSAPACTGTCAHARYTSQIHGIVQDSSGSAVAGAEIHASLTSNNAVLILNSGPDGGFNNNYQFKSRLGQ